MPRTLLLLAWILGVLTAAVAWRSFTLLGQASPQTGAADSIKTLAGAWPWFELAPGSTGPTQSGLGEFLGSLMRIHALHWSGHAGVLVPWQGRVFGAGLLILWIGLPAHALMMAFLRSTGKLDPKASALAAIERQYQAGNLHDVMQGGKRLLEEFTGVLSPEEEFTVRRTMGRAALRLGMSFESLEIFGRLLERAPTDVEIQGSLIQTYAAMGRDVPKPRVSMMLSYIEQAGAQDAKLIDYVVDQIFKVKDRISSTERLSGLMKSWGWQSPRTLTLLAAVDRKSRGPTHRADCLLVLGNAEVERGNLPLATDHLLAAVDADPSLREAHVLLRTAARGAGRVEDVKRAYAEIQGRSEDAALAEAIENLDAK